MQQVVTNLQQQLSSQQQTLQQLQAVMDAQLASAAQRENALQAQLADLSDRLNLNMAEAEFVVEPEPVARRHRAFVVSRAFSKLSNFDSKAASWKDWSFKLENMAEAVVASSRESLEWAAQQETLILTVDDVEAGPDSVEVNPQVCGALADLLEGEALDIVQNTTRGAGLEAWRKLVRRFDPETVGRKRTLLSRIINPGTVKVHELSRAIEPWVERQIVSIQSAREKISDIHLNLTRLSDYAAPIGNRNVP